MRIDGGEDADLDEFHGWQCKSTKMSGPSASSAVKFCWSTTGTWSRRHIEWSEDGGNAVSAIQRPLNNKKREKPTDDL
ncbi:hypothetical protein pipiens_014612 [Culex pipiens pipiens]|uniref:Uncharacterized protein n=1 Tax=Culex pipiens pipiens TaxID=38569 RepID=A0ABD1CTV3_CULPP